MLTKKQERIKIKRLIKHMKKNCKWGIGPSSLACGFVICDKECMIGTNSKGEIIE